MKDSQTAAPFGDLFPPGAEVIAISSFEDGRAVLRSGDCLVAFGANSPYVAVDEEGKVRLADRDNAGAHSAFMSWTDFFSSKEVHFMHGTAHAQRRKSLAPLFGRDAHIWARDKVIVPRLTKRLAVVLASPDHDGVAHIEVVAFARRLFAQVAAGLIGLDGAETEEGTDELLRIAEIIDAALLLVHDKVEATPDESEHILQNAVDAREAFRMRFYAPSMRTRRDLVERHRQGDLAREALPHDLLALIASDAPTFEDPDSGLAQAGAFLSPLTSGTASMLVHALADLIAWFATHPEDSHLWARPAFMEQAISETVRLHQPVVIPRLALTDFILPSGRKIRAGQYVAVDRFETNQDPSVYGADAGLFNPRRVVPEGAYPFGLGFGSGAHMCVAMPIVMGQGGISGLLAPVLRALFAVGVRPDPAKPAVRRGGFPYRDVYLNYHALLGPAHSLPDSAVAPS